MKRSFSAAAGLAATGVDIEWLARMLPRVDPTRVTVREASPRFRSIWAKGIVAVTMPWGIYFAPTMMDRYDIGAEPLRVGQLLVHELTHVEQLKRLGVVRHVFQYVTEYLIGRLKRKGHWESYRSIRLEVEARSVAQLVIEGPR